MENQLSECVYAMSPFVIRGYCVTKTIIFYRQTINYDWFLGHLKYLTWVNNGKDKIHKAFDLVCLRHLSTPSRNISKVACDNQDMSAMMDPA